MTTVESLASRFALVWNRGERPDVDEYLAQAPPGRRDELAARITAWLAVAPDPDYTAGQREEIAASPLVAKILARTSRREAAAAAGWAVTLPRLRARAGLQVADLARRLVPALGLAGGTEPKVAGYLERMEHEELEASGVSQRVLDALGDLLGTTGAALADAARTSVPLRADVPGDLTALFRADEDAPLEDYAQDLHALTRAARAPAPDDVDRLFTGGREA